MFALDDGVGSSTSSCSYASIPAGRAHGLVLAARDHPHHNGVEATRRHATNGRRCDDKPGLVRKRLISARRPASEAARSRRVEALPRALEVKRIGHNSFQKFNRIETADGTGSHRRGDPGTHQADHALTLRRREADAEAHRGTWPLSSRMQALQ